MSGKRTVVQLREALKALGLPTGGNKAELEKRLAEAESKAQQESEPAATKERSDGASTKSSTTPKRPRLASQGQSDEANDGSGTTKESDAQVHNKLSENVAAHSESNDTVPPKQEEDLLTILSSTKDDFSKGIYILDALNSRDPVRMKVFDYMRTSLTCFTDEALRHPVYQYAYLDSQFTDTDWKDVYQRAGLLQKLAFKLGIDDCALASPLRSLEIAAKHDFFVEKGNDTKEAVSKLIGSSRDVDIVLLKRALKEYFHIGPNHIAASGIIFFEPITWLTAAQMRDLTRPRKAVNMDHLIARGAFELKLELANCTFRGYKKARDVLKADKVIVRTSSSRHEIQIGASLSELDDLAEVVPLDQMDDIVCYKRLQSLQDISRHSAALNFGTSFQSALFPSDNGTTSNASQHPVRRTIDFWHSLEDFEQLKRCFPDEVESLDAGETNSDRFVVVFKPGKKATVKGAGISKTGKIESLKDDEVIALRDVLSYSTVLVKKARLAATYRLSAKAIAAFLSNKSASRVLVVNGHSASLAAETLARLKDEGCEARDMCCLSNDQGFFSLSRSVRRIAKERNKVLTACLNLAKELNVEEPEESAKDCESALNFLTEAVKLVDERANSLKQRVEAFRGFELFLNRPKEAEKYVWAVHAKVVATSLDALLDLPPKVLHGFDFVLFEDCTRPYELILALSRLANPASQITCFVEEDVKLENAISFQRVHLISSPAASRNPPGFAKRVMRKNVASLREEIELAEQLRRFSLAIGYSKEDVQIIRLKQDQAWDQSRPYRIVLIISSGATKETTVESVIEHFDSLAKDALVVISSDREWVKQDSAPLEVVLGERVGEPYDAELRAETLFPVEKINEFASVVALTATGS